MALAPEWMSYTKESSTSQGSRFLGKERERGVPKYGRQLSFSHMPRSSSGGHNPAASFSSSSSASPPLDLVPDRTSSVPFACSLSSPPAPPHTPASILGDPNPRVLNRSKSSPGFGSPKSKQKKSPDRAFSSFNKPPKPKPPKPPLSPTSYMKSISQPNLLDNEKTSNWIRQKIQQQQTSQSPPTPSPHVTSSPTSSPSSLSSSSSTSSSQPPMPPSASPPLPPTSPPLVLVPEIDKLKTLVPATGMPPKSVRPRAVVGPPLPLAKKAPTAQPLTSSAASPSPNPNGLAAYFRKATSEPSLMHHKVSAQDAALAARRAEAAAKKARVLENEKAQAQLLKEAVSSKQPKRSNFFQHVIKQEEQGAPTEDDSPIGIDLAASTEAPYSPSTTPPLLSPPLSSSISSSSSSLSSSNSSNNNHNNNSNSNNSNGSNSNNNNSNNTHAGIRSPLPEDMKDEERFLRTMGWVPDEEDPVPVLEEDEIRDVRVKIILSRRERDGDNSRESRRRVARESALA